MTDALHRHADIRQPATRAWLTLRCHGCRTWVRQHRHLVASAVPRRKRRGRRIFPPCHLTADPATAAGQRTRPHDPAGSGKSRGWYRSCITSINSVAERRMADPADQNLAHSSPDVKGFSPPTTQRAFHQPHSKRPLPGVAFFCAEFSRCGCVTTGRCVLSAPLSRLACEPRPRGAGVLLRSDLSEDPVRRGSQASRLSGRTGMG